MYIERAGEGRGRGLFDFDMRRLGLEIVGLWCCGVE